MTPPCQLAEAAEAAELQMIPSTGLEDMPFIASGPGLLDPPESMSDESDGEQVLSPSPGTREQPPNLERVDENLFKKIPKVTRTYTKKVKRVLPRYNEIFRLPLTRSSTRDEALLDELLLVRPDSAAKRLVSRKISQAKTAKKNVSALPKKGKLQPLQEEDENHQKDHDEGDRDIVIKKNEKKTKRKKRRVPVNELALVTLVESPQYREYPSASNQVRTSFGPAYILVLVAFSGPV